MDWFSNILWDKALIAHVPLGVYISCSQKAVSFQQRLKELLGFRDMTKYDIKNGCVVCLTFPRLQSSPIMQEELESSHSCQSSASASSYKHFEEMSFVIQNSAERTEKCCRLSQVRPPLIQS